MHTIFLVIWIIGIVIMALAGLTAPTSYFPYHPMYWNHNTDEEKRIQAEGFETWKRGERRSLNIALFGFAMFIIGIIEYSNAIQ